MVKEKVKPIASQKDESEISRELILFNDDVNTFDFVIQSLIEVCSHLPEQAEQCAMVAHLKGKCGIKTGNYQELKPIHEEMTARGLTVSIE